MRSKSMSAVIKSRWITGFGILMLACVISVNAMAQRGGGNRLAPEKLDAAWSAEGGGIAHDIGLDAGKTGKLVAAYKTSRAAQAKEMGELMASGQRGPGMFQDMMAINESQAATLKTNLEAIISKKEAETAVTTLGSYNREWDRLVDTLLGFKLDEADQFKALSLIANYVVESDKARAEAIAAMDFESMRTASAELKGMLDMTIASILSAEQIETWKTATARRQRGGQRGGGGGGRPRQ